MSTLPLTYKEYKFQVGAVKARQALLRTYQDCQSIKATARNWSCHRQTVRTALTKQDNGDLNDGDRTPINQPLKTSYDIEGKIKTIRLETGYGKVRIKRELETQYDIKMKVSTIGKIINRLNLPKKSYRNAWRKKTRQKFDSQYLEPFERNEVDTKEILDKRVYLKRFMSILKSQSTYLSINGLGWM